MQTKNEGEAPSDPAKPFPLPFPPLYSRNSGASTRLGPRTEGRTGSRKRSLGIRHIQVGGKQGASSPFCQTGRFWRDKGEQLINISFRKSYMIDATSLGSSAAQAEVRGATRV